MSSYIRHIYIYIYMPIIYPQILPTYIPYLVMCVHVGNCIVLCVMVVYASKIRVGTVYVLAATIHKPFLNDSLSWQMSKTSLNRMDVH